MNLLEDWATTGFRTEHPEPPAASHPLPEPKTPEAGSAAEAPALKTAKTAAPAPATHPAAEAPAPAVPPPAGVDRAAELAAAAAEIAGCTRCGLAVNRTMAVPGEGALDAPVMFVGEGPGADEDRTGRPFVGAAGKYLDTWLHAIELPRDRCFIANCVKCRPPQNREPHPDEIGACLPFLLRQIAIVKPRVICCLGRIAAQTLLGTTQSLGQLRGRVHEHRGIPVLVTYHPSAVLRDKASLRKPVWEDLKVLKGLLGS